MLETHSFPSPDNPLSTYKTPVLPPLAKPFFYKQANGIQNRRSGKPSFLRFATKEKAFNAPTRTYVRDAKAMATTPAGVKECPNSYVFVIDMPGLKSGDIKVQIEDDRVLNISGDGKFMRKFALPEIANVDAISAVCQDGVLTVTVNKLPPPEPKKPKTIEVKIA